MSTTVFLAVTFLALAMLAAQLQRIRMAQKRAIKHDRVLFPFCQLRRDVMQFLRETAFKKPQVLSREEYASARRLVEALDVTIRNYNRHKTVMFNLRKVETHLRAYRQSAKPAPALPDNPRIREFHDRFRGLLVKACIAYTPWIRSELFLRLMALAWQLGVDEGARRRARYVLNNAPQVRADWLRYGAGDGGLAAV
ncbi:MAG: hypothetical protein OD918_00575 [Gammaproteobacteria bacterium]